MPCSTLKGVLAVTAIRSVRNTHGMDLKKCSACGENKPLDAYYMEKGKPRAKCKDCHKKKVYETRDNDPTAKARAKAWKDANRDRINETQRQYVERNREEVNKRRREQRAERLEHFRAQKREWRADNAERINAATRAAWVLRKDEVNALRRNLRATDPDYAERERSYARASRARYPERIAERHRRWREANPDRVHTLNMRRRTRLAQVEHQDYSRREIYDRDGGRCKLCGVELPFKSNAFHIDHIVPIALGGPDIPANVQLACPPCNRGKHAKLEGQIHLPV